MAEYQEISVKVISKQSQQSVFFSYNWFVYAHNQDFDFIQSQP